ncbi:thioredoxin family protein [Paenibacillus sp. PAMC21692]|uniref:thioredoxin family protein n=1 Tax=Paenibacillus sp. PAMC21692 TaxID=2762320 RepID=UPI00164D5EA4|nr:thioredoxin family protein [Paenibacillus sp. PAMC21692]QNK56386.1 thioredoxin family protein [Paenibacillus sp. PAMC21692]
MPLQELDEYQLKRLAAAQVGRTAVLFTTPLCGTCKVAERMLEIVEAAGCDYPLYKTNINFTPRLRDDWQIESVPCLVLLKNGKVISKEYAMRSVDYLYSLMKSSN